MCAILEPGRPSEQGAAAVGGEAMGVRAEGEFDFEPGIALGEQRVECGQHLCGLVLAGLVDGGFKQVDQAQGAKAWIVSLGRLRRRWFGGDLGGRIGGGEVDAGGDAGGPQAGVGQGGDDPLE